MKVQKLSLPFFLCTFSFALVGVSPKKRSREITVCMSTLQIVQNNQAGRNGIVGGSEKRKLVGRESAREKGREKNSVTQRA